MEVQNTEFSRSPLRGRKGGERCAVILAGGEGSRLRTLTRTIAGDARPKQFCPLIRGKSLLDATRERVAKSIAPENTFYSLTAKHERYFRGPLRNVPASRRIIQPQNKGTAPAILYSLMRLAMVKPDAAVAFFPSDHFFNDDEGFMDQVESAFLAASLNPDSIVLLGIEPDKAEASYGWIEPANSLFGGEARSFSRVERFWEKPPAKVARRLLSSGCLWNSFVMVGRVEAFLVMFREHLPMMYGMFDMSGPFLGDARETAAVRSIYTWIKETNFSSEVLERAVARLLVMRVAGVGWTDLGEPQRVLGVLTGLGIQPEWAAGIAA